MEQWSEEAEGGRQFNRSAILSIFSTPVNSSNTEHILCANRRNTKALGVKLTLKPEAQPERVRMPGPEVGESDAFSHRPRRARGNPECPRDESCPAVIEQRTRSVIYQSCPAMLSIVCPLWVLRTKSQKLTSYLFKGKLKV